MDIIRATAEEYKILYQQGQCTIEEAKEKIIPYIDIINTRAKELAKAYSVRYKPVSFSAYVR